MSNETEGFKGGGGLTDRQDRGPQDSICRDSSDGGPLCELHGVIIPLIVAAISVAILRAMAYRICIAPFESVRQWKAFDADTGKDSAREVREYFIPDFSNWKDHDSYKAAFDRLIRDLTAKDLSAHA